MPTSPPLSLTHVLYVSRATEPFSDAALDDLLDRARRFNVDHDITGLLLYDHVDAVGLSQFCQYIEGPPGAVAAVMARIEADVRHARISVLHEGRSERRLFSTWSMGFEHVSRVPDGEGVREQIVLTTASPDQVPRNVSAALLRTFVAMSPSGGH